jgi:PAS domain S-box-containing protein
MNDVRPDILEHLKVLFSGHRQEDDVFQIMEYFPAIIYTMDLQDKKTTYINQSRLSQTLGFTRDEIQSWNSDVLKMIFEEDATGFESELEKFIDLSDDAELAYDSRFNHKSDNWHYFRTRGKILSRDAEGKPASLLFLSEDITDVITSQNEVLALKKLVDDTEEFLSYGSWSIDPLGEIITWTDGMQTLLEYEKEDFPATTRLDFYLSHLSVDDQLVFRNGLEQAKRSKDGFEVRYHLTTKRGQLKFISTKGKVVLDANGKVIKIVGVNRDITRQTKINNELQNYRSTILEREQFLNQGSWQIRLDTGEMSWSQGMTSLFGYSNESQQSRQAVKDHLREKLANMGIDAGRSTLAFEGDHQTIESEIILPDGSRKQVETFVKVIRNHTDEIESVIGTCRDVTQLKAYEASLQDKINELKRSNKELEEFAYVASHDLQEPLRKLTTFSERLQTKFGNVLGSDGLLYLDRIVAATANMRLLIDNLLDFSRTATSGKHFVHADLKALLQESLNSLELKIEETGTTVIAEDLPAIDVIPSQIKQLFDNLLNNSIKFRKRDEPCLIKISCAPITPAEMTDWGLRSDQTYYRFSVRDNGIGFESEYQDKIFLIFQRLHGKSEYPGSGIGLAICKKIVENHNGIIFARGNPGEGALFSFVLPANHF